MVKTATLCDTPHTKSLSKGNIASALRLTMLQIFIGTWPKHN